MAYRDKTSRGSVDLESLEIYIRHSMHSAGRIILEELLNSENCEGHDEKICCEKGHVVPFKEYRPKDLLTVLGTVEVKRAYYYDESCRKGFCPRDTVLDINSTSFSPGMRRIMGKVGASRSFGLGREDINDMAGIKVNPKEIERVSYQLGRDAEAFRSSFCDMSAKPVPKMYICIDGTGVPVVRKETAGRRGRKAGGLPKTREAKLGCVFTQTTLDEKGYPIRDECSTTYVGAIETSEEFGNRIYAEALSRGIESAEKVCVLGDGAPWIWNIADIHFYGAIQIVDVWHARKHYWTVAKTMFGSSEAELRDWTAKRRKELDRGEVEKVTEAMRRLNPPNGESQKIIEREIGYFEKNMERMRYIEFRKQGLFVGSGVVEAGARTVIGQRLKQSGMRWTVKNANDMISLRCCILSDRWEDFWEDRACA